MNIRTFSMKFQDYYSPFAYTEQTDKHDAYQPNDVYKQEQVRMPC